MARIASASLTLFEEAEIIACLLENASTLKKGGLGASLNGALLHRCTEVTGNSLVRCVANRARTTTLRANVQGRSTVRCLAPSRTLIPDKPTNRRHVGRCDRLVSLHSTNLIQMIHKQKAVYSYSLTSDELFHERKRPVYPYEKRKRKEIDNQQYV